MSQRDYPDCSPATPITETATLHVAVSSACGTELDRYKMEAKKRTWAPDADDVWDATHWKKVTPPTLVIPTMDERRALENAPFPLEIVNVNSSRKSPCFPPHSST